MVNCKENVKFYWELGLPAQEDLTPHSVYFIKALPNTLMYVTDALGEPFLVGGVGETITLISPNQTISILEVGGAFELDIAQSVLDTIIKLHNAFPDLQGGLPGEFFHLSQAQHSYLTDIVSNDTIGAINTQIGTINAALNYLAEPPVYIQPSSAITLNGSTSNITAEVGSNLSLTINQTFNQGDAGNKVSDILTKNGSDIIGSQVIPFVTTLNPVPLGVTTYSGKVFYDEGDCKLNNIGLEDCTGHILAGNTVSTPNRTVTGIYPVFYLKSSTPITADSMQAAINAGTANKLVISSTGTFSIPYAPNNEFVAVAYPASSTTKTKWQVTVLDSGDIPGGVFGAVATRAVNSPTSLWSAISYKIHVTPQITNAGATNIQLLNS